MTRLAVLHGSVRPNSAGTGVADWIVEKANTVDGVDAELVSLASFNLPVFAEEVAPARAMPTAPEGVAFNETLASYDAVIIVSPEYNHSIPGALTNALDYLRPGTLANKGIGLVGYSFTGGIRPVEHLRQILSNFEAGVVNTQVSLSLVTDFVNMTEFAPAPYHEGEVPALVDAVVERTKALSALR